jgi:hypothetical protein
MKPYIMCQFFLFFGLAVAAQTNYYDVDKTFYENGYTYQCDVLEGAKFVTLYNIENKFTNVNQIDRNTSKGISIKENMHETQLEDDSWTKQKSFSIINGAFSTAQKQLIKDGGRDICIILYVDPDTGKIVDVVYKFLSVSPYGVVPVSVYRKIEIELKKNVWFVPTEQGKRRNYIIVGWLHEVR